MDGQRDHPCRCGPVSVRVGGEDGQQRVPDHRQQGPASPRGPTADLMLVEPGQALPGLETLLDDSAASSDAYEFPA